VSMVRTIVSVSAGVALMVGVPPAGAGGVSWLEFDRRYLVVGHRVTGSTAFFDDASGRTGGRIADGPYTAYLVPDERWIEPPTIPAKAIPLGTLGIADIGRPGGMARAHLTFTVPDVPPGRYTIGLCNDPCAKSSVGDLYGGGIEVVATPLDARLAVEAGRSDRKLERLEARLEERMNGLLRGWERLGEMRNAQTLLADRVAELETQVAGLQGELRERPSAGQAWWLVGTASLVAAGTFLARRRRRPAERQEPARRKGAPLVVPVGSDLIPSLEDDLSRTT
jgi:hypothetical protein